MFDLKLAQDNIEVSNMINISNNDGYDNQPFFENDTIIYYSSNRNGQTDILKYNRFNDSKQFINNSDGSEYSPQKIPKSNKLSAIRLDTDGAQYFYTFDLNDGQAYRIKTNLIIAYYTWLDNETIVSAVIEGDALNLFTLNTKNGKSQKLENHVGRSFQKIPKTNLISFISKEDEKDWKIKTFNPINGHAQIITSTLNNQEDIYWLSTNTIITSKNSVLYKYTLGKSSEWEQVTDLKSLGLLNITRMRSNTKNTKLLIVAEQQ